MAHIYNRFFVLSDPANSASRKNALCQACQRCKHDEDELVPLNVIMTMPKWYFHNMYPSETGTLRVSCIIHLLNRGSQTCVILSQLFGG